LNENNLLSQANQILNGLHILAVNDNVLSTDPALQL